MGKPVQESHSKHIDIWYHFICDHVSAKDVELMFMPGEMNPTDMFTKNMAKVKFAKFREELGLDLGQPKIPRDSSDVLRSWPVDQNMGVC